MVSGGCVSRLSILEELRDFDTALLANTIGYIDPTPAHEFYMAGSIQSVTPSLGPTVGVAATCELDTSTPGGEHILDPYYQQLDEIAKIDVPVVWVVKTVGSRPDHECIMGDGMAKGLYANGCLGVVTDGGLRDIEGMLTIPFAAYCRQKTIHHCALRFRSINQPVEVGGITIRPGDVIHANAEGVIRIPPTCLEILPARATQMRAFEHAAHRVMRRTDLTSREKPSLVRALLADYGFGK
jgi:4-hydroxy-4-methyl-2-oxoglutarate aldolase